jgi:hypothetical protein
MQFMSTILYINNTKSVNCHYKNLKYVENTLHYKTCGQLDTIQWIKHIKNTN